jgi:L-Ala-D/L-Glu epimerase
LLRIESLRARAFDVALLTPFGIAGGTQEVAANVLVELRLSDGTLGLGEAAPFPAVNGETQGAVLAALAPLAAAVAGADAERYRHVAALASELLVQAPTALMAFETALLDALCRHAGRSLWHHFGGSEAQLVTDITLPTGDVESASDGARQAAARGFTRLKIKVGRDGVAFDAARVRAALAAAPACDAILDANAAFSAEDALALIGELGATASRIVLFEQPVAREDWDGLARVERNGRIPVAADESARSASEVAELARRRAVSVINVKPAKTGLLGAWDMALVAKAHGLRLMIGGMVETELAMTASACLAGGIGGFDFVDLDTFFFMAPRPLTGGFAVRGATLDVGALGVGHGVEVTAL